MTTPGNGIQGGPLEHLQQAVLHGLGTLRCYVTMLAAEGELRGRRLLNLMLWMFALAGVGVAGVALFAFGAAQWIESRLAVPGAGAMIAGMGLVAIFLAVALMHALRQERDS